VRGPGVIDGDDDPAVGIDRTCTLDTTGVVETAGPPAVVCRTMASTDTTGPPWSTGRADGSIRRAVYVDKTGGIDAYVPLSPASGSMGPTVPSNWVANASKAVVHGRRAVYPRALRSLRQ
jgi:hypothetical protein